jgi:hypothetical protein
MFTEDTASLLADFGVTATYKSGGVGQGTSITVIKDEPFQGAFGVTGTNPTAIARAVDVPTFGNTDTLTIGGTVYRLVNDEPLDDGVFVRFQLEKQ